MVLQELQGERSPRRDEENAVPQVGNSASVDVAVRRRVEVAHAHGAAMVVLAPLYPMRNVRHSVQINDERRRVAEPREVAPADAVGQVSLHVARQGLRRRACRLLAKFHHG